VGVNRLSIVRFCCCEGTVAPKKDKKPQPGSDGGKATTAATAARMAGGGSGWPPVQPICLDRICSSSDTNAERADRLLSYGIDRQLLRRPRLHTTASKFNLNPFLL